MLFRSDPNKFDFDNFTSSNNNTLYMSGSASRATYSSATSYTLSDDDSNFDWEDEFGLSASMGSMIETSELETISYSSVLD